MYCAFRVVYQYHHPANTRRWPNVGLLFGQRQRRWPNINPTLGQRSLFHGQLQPFRMGYYSGEIMLMRRLIIIYNIIVVFIFHTAQYFYLIFFTTIISHFTTKYCVKATTVLRKFHCRTGYFVFLWQSGQHRFLCFTISTLRFNIKYLARQIRIKIIIVLCVALITMSIYSRR